MPLQLIPSGGCCVTASLKLQISICHSGSSAASGLKGVHVKATSLQNKAIKIPGLHCSESAIAWSHLQQKRKTNHPNIKWAEGQNWFSEQSDLKLAQSVVLGQLCVAPPLSSPYGRNRQTLAPRAPNLLCDRGLSLSEFPFHHHRLSAPGNTTTYTPSTRLLINLTTGLLLLFGKAMGL